MLDSSIDRTTNITLNIFWAGFIIFTLGFSMPGTTKASFLICQGFQILGILLFVLASIKLISWEFENSYLRFIFNIYCFWSIFIILRGFQFEYESIKNVLLDAWRGIFLYFVPFIILFPQNVFYFRKIFDVIIILGVSFIIYSMLFYRVLIWGLGGYRMSVAIIEYFAHLLSISSGFLLLTIKYHSIKKILFALFIIIVTFLFASIRARRGLMFMSISILFVAYIVFYYTNKGRILSIVLSVFLVCLLFIYGVTVYGENKSGLFGLVTGRMEEDTRTGVEEYFYKSMNSTDWIIGKGMNGQYYCPGINEVEGSLTIYRSVIETGYLQIILKGGIISLGLFLLIAIPALFKGLFYSRNLLSKAAGIWILLFLIYLYPTTVAAFTLNYLLIWLSIGICYNESLRGKTDNEILLEFQETIMQKS